MKSTFKKLLGSLILLLLLPTVNLYPQNNPSKYILGAIPISEDEYAELPKVDWNVLYANKDERRIQIQDSKSNITMLNCPPIGDQGAQGSCVGWAVGYAAVSILTYPKYNDWNIAKRSPSYIFNQIQLDTCKSAYVTSGLNIAKNQGVCSLDLMPYDEGGCATQPNNEQRFDAALHNIISWGTLIKNNVANIKQALDLGNPVVVSFDVYDSFWNMWWYGNGIWNTNDTSGESDGGHASCIIGYDDTKQMFKVMNSWGKGANNGDNGFFG